MQIQCHDFDARIGHTSIDSMRYIFWAYHYRLFTDHRSFNDLFHDSCDVISDITFIEDLMPILTLIADRMRSIGPYFLNTFDAFYYVAIDVALNTLAIVKNRKLNLSENLESSYLSI